MRTQKGAPRHRALTAGRDARAFQNVRDRGASDAMSQVLQRTLEPLAATFPVQHPSRVLGAFSTQVRCGRPAPTVWAVQLVVWVEWAIGVGDRRPLRLG